MEPNLQQSDSPSVQSPHPIAWTIAGSDSGGGAGIQADIKTMTGLGVHACSAITAITAQSTRGVGQISQVSPGMIEAQLLALSADLPPRAIKIGMLGNAAAITAVVRFLESAKTFVVCDPVMIATHGAALLESDAFGVLCNDLLPLVDLLTPNVPEAEKLVSYKIDTVAEMERAAKDILRYGVKSVLIKGGHFPGPISHDFWTNGRESAWLNSPRIDTPHSHGGGCTLSSAIAAGYALGFSELDSVVIAKAYVNQGLRNAGGIGGGRGPLAHLGWPDSPQDLPWITSTPAAVRAQFPDAGPMGLYPIVDRSEWIEKLAPLGVDMIQLRIKDLDGAALESEIKAGIASAARFKTRLYINDHWRLALKHKAHGVHIGQDDFPTTDLHAIQHAGLRLGVSTHGYAEVARAIAVRPSYIAIGTLFESPSKTFNHTPMGLCAFAQLRKCVSGPVVAIGGITVERAAEVRAAGADGLAVISDITRAPDLAARVRQWQAVLDAHR